MGLFKLKTLTGPQPHGVELTLGLFFQTNPCLVLLQTSLVVLRLVFVAPFLWLLAFCRFYSRKHDSPKEIIKRQSATNIR